ncbi:hypothetical protein QPK87_04835 [Kamptonema cortianum]|nr:hypothetical protein [Geitlerinema splendidum]MDK3155902.1 hypothetical protein [Kamptonema cortianum]
MAVYRSGRERRLIVSSAWQCPIKVEYRCTGTWPAQPNRFATWSERFPLEMEVRSVGALARYEPVSGFGSWPANASCSNQIANVPYQIRQTVKLWEGTPFEMVAMADQTSSYTVAHQSIFEQDPSGVVMVEADVEEWFEVIDPIADTDSDGFPLYGGGSVKDLVTGRGIRFFERLKPGGTIQVSMSGLAPVQLTDTISQAKADAVGEIFHGVDRRGKVWAENDLCSMTISGSVAGESCPAPYFKESSFSAFDARSGFSLWIQKPVDSAGESYGYVAAAVPAKLDWEGRLFSFGEPFPDAVDLKLEKSPGEVETLIANPAAGKQFEQVAWSAFAVLDGVNQASEGADTRGPSRCWIDPPSLVANGDEAVDWRMGFRGKSWTALSLSHASPRVLDDGTSLAGWTAGSNTSIGLSGGAISLSVAGGTGLATRVWAPVVRGESYRYLRIRFRSLVGANAPMRVGIGGKSWVFESGSAGAWANSKIDLCVPHGLSSTVDEKESRFPLSVEGLVEDSDYWGVSRIESLVLSDLADGETYEIDEISLIRESDARVSFLPALNHWKLEQVGQVRQVKPFAWSSVDGRIADCWDMWQTVSQFGWNSLADLGSAFAQIGWTVVPNAAFPDEYHRNNREATLAWGGGVRFDDGWLPGTDVAAQSLGVVAQAIWDEVEIYGGAGDVWSENGSYGGLTLLRAAKQLRGQAWGLVVSGDSSLSGLNVELRLSNGESRGSGISDNWGRYLTGSHYGLGNVMHRVVAGNESSPLFIVKSRGRHRRVLREFSSAGGVSFDWHLSGMAVRAWIRMDGRIRIETKSNGFGASYRLESTEFSAGSLCVRWDDGRRLRLWLLSEEGGEIVERYSDDMGESWTMSQVLATGDVKFPTLAVHPDGRRFAYWVNGSQVDGVIRDRNGNVLSAVAGARTGVESVGLAAGTVEKPGGLVQVELVSVESGAVVSSLSSDGKSFT